MICGGVDVLSSPARGGTRYEGCIDPGREGHRESRRDERRRRRLCSQLPAAAKARPAGDPRRAGSGRSPEGHRGHRPAPPAAGGRVPPHNLEAEASVLGSLMLDRNAIVRVADFLRPEDFYLDHHAQVYRAALNLYDRADPIDLLTLAAELETMRVLERIGGQAFLAELQSGVPTAANVEYYGHLVEEGATKRKLIGAGGPVTPPTVRC